MNKNKQLLINITASLVAFVLNLGISFFLTPYITRTVGVEAYGFVALGSNFVNYASLVTIALNSMAGRYITIAIHTEKWDQANKYFNSVLMANLVVAGVMLIPSLLCIAYLDQIVSVPPRLLSDVRLLFIFLFANFLLGIIVSTFSVATFATNRLYLQSMRNIEGNVLKASILVGLFWLLRPAVSFIGFATFMMLMYTTFFNIMYTRKFLTNIKINFHFFDWVAIKELIASGIWNTVIRVGSILLEGVDLLITNLFISSVAMGTLALAKTIPSLIASLVGILAGVFMPNFTVLFAKQQNEELIISIKRSMNLLGVIVTIPIAILAAFGEVFFKLWVPTQDAKMLQVLSVITIATFIVSGSVNCIYNIFTVTNKLKANALVLLLTGVSNIIIVLILLKTTNFGIYAIAGVSTILGIIRNVVFTAPYGAKCLNVKWNTFFPEIMKSVLSFFIVTIIGIGLNSIFLISSWPLLFIMALITGLLGVIINIMLMVSKNERQYYYQQLLTKFNKTRATFKH